MLRTNLAMLAFFLAVGFAPPTQAAPVTETFNLTSIGMGTGSISGTDFSSAVLSLNGGDGVTFDAQVTVH